MSKKEKQTHPEVGEDATQYGEFVSTYFAWIPLPDQKLKADEMAQMTKTQKTQKRTDPLQGGTDPLCRRTDPKCGGEQ